MAIMHPNHVPFFNVYSEERFYNACKEQLSDKFHVFYSVRWYITKANGEREDSECDFLIFNPDYGYLCIEVKGGRGIRVENGKWYLEGDGGRELKKSPFEQAEQSMRFFKQYYEEETETTFDGVYGYAVAFPNFAIGSMLSVSAPLELTLDTNDMGALAKRITALFIYWRGKRTNSATFLSVENRTKFINTVNKRVALSIAAGALIQDKERELHTINASQDSIIDCLVNYPRAFIIGGAGTGKTWIGIKKIQRCTLGGGNALFLCYNKALAEEVASHIDPQMAVSANVDAYAHQLLRGKVSEAHEDRSGCKEYSQLLCDLSDLPKFDLVVVDEAQDFTEDWAMAANLFLKDDCTSSLYVFYDENQNIFRRDFKDKFFITNDPFVLRYNIRNTANIYKYTKEVTQLGKDTEANTVEGVEPDQRLFTKKSQLVSFIDSVASRLIGKEGIANGKIIILSDRKRENSVLRGTAYVGGYRIVDNKAEVGNDGILFRTIQSFKGLEADIVIYINHTYPNQPKTEEYRAKLYTAYTRARFYLYALDYEDRGANG